MTVTDWADLNWAGSRAELNTEDCRQLVNRVAAGRKHLVGSSWASGDTERSRNLVAVHLLLARKSLQHRAGIETSCQRLIHKDWQQVPRMGYSNNPSSLTMGGSGTLRNRDRLRRSI